MTQTSQHTLSGKSGFGGTPPNDEWLKLVPLEAGGMSYHPQYLLPGDLIVSTSAAWISARIRDLTNSPVSHVAIYIGDGQVIESVDEGVVVRSLTDALQDDYYAAAFRADALTDPQRSTLVRWLRSQVGKQYDYVAIISLLQYQQPEKWFCSELVFAAFEHVGAPLGPLPSQSNPGDVLTISGVTYLGHLKYPPNVMSQSTRRIGGLASSEDQRDTMVPPDAGSMPIDTSVLQVGDLVVSSNDSALSAASRTRTDQPAPHVALYIGNGEVIEAIEQSVTRRPIDTMLAGIHSATAYRYTGLTTGQQTTIRDFALSKIGEPFGVIAVASLQRMHHDEVWVCPEAVFEAYASAGIRLGDSHLSTPGAVITMTGFEYLGHLAAGEHVGDRSVRALSGGGKLLGEIVKSAVVGDMGDVKWEFDQLRGKFHPFHERWTATERAAHDAPAKPYRTTRFETTEMRWDLGNIGATIPVSFEYNGHYIAELRVSRPINIDENFLYKLSMSAEVMPRQNAYRDGGLNNIARVDLRITWVFDYEGFTKIFQNFIDDTFTFIEEYRIYADGDVHRRLSGRGRKPSDLQFMDHGQRLSIFDAVRRANAQSMETDDGIELVDANFEGEWMPIAGSGPEPVVSEQSARALRARQMSVRGPQGVGRTFGSRAMSAPAEARVDRAVQAGVQAGASESQARAFIDRLTRPQSVQSLGARSPDATVHLPEVEFFNSWQGAIVKELIEGAMTAVTPQALLDYCTRNNRTIGLGVVAGAGLGGAVDFGAGIVFAPGNKIGFYGSFSLGGGWNFEASVGLQLTYILGDETLFSGRAVTLGGTIDASEGLGGGGRVVMDPTMSRVIGYIGEVTVSVGIPVFSAIEATIAQSDTVTTFALSRPGPMIGGLPLRPAAASSPSYLVAVPRRHRADSLASSPWR